MTTAIDSRHDIGDGALELLRRRALAHDKLRLLDARQFTALRPWRPPFAGGSMLTHSPTGSPPD
jgi:hypothetical protein